MTVTAAPTLPLDRLDAELTGAVHLPGTAGYAAAAPWNMAVPLNAVAVVAAVDAHDVTTAVRFAADHGVQVTVQATGHGAVPIDVPTLLISTNGLRELHIDDAGRTRVGAGNRWSDVLAAAPPHFAALAGSAPGGGVVGFLSGGGRGPVARSFGMSSDRVTAFDVVTGDGELRRATPTDHPELFWGLRGGKGTLGVVTAVEFDLVPLAELLGGCMYFDAADVAAVTRAWAAWTTTLPERGTSSLAILRLPKRPGVPAALAGKVCAAVRFAWVGDVEQGRAALAPLLAVAQPVFGGIDVMPYSAIGMIHNDPVEPMPMTETGTLLSGLPADAVERLLDFVGPQAACPQVIVELRLLGGAITRPAGPDAVSHRTDAYALMAVGIAAPPIVAATEAHAGALIAGLAEWDTGHCLPNVAPDPRQIARKYDAATLRRLAAASEVYDPEQVIAAAAPIRAAAGR